MPIKQAAPQSGQPLSTSMFYMWRCVITIARADGTLDPREDEIIKKLHLGQMASLNLNEIRSQVKTVVTNEMFRHDLEMSKIRPQQGLSAIIDQLLLRMGIDILEN